MTQHVTDNLREYCRRWEAACNPLAAVVAPVLAIVDKLPKTADGVPVVPGMTVWVVGDYGDGRSIHEFVVWCLSHRTGDDGGTTGSTFCWGHGDSYSTREAAEAAREEARER